MKKLVAYTEQEQEVHGGVQFAKAQVAGYSQTPMHPLSVNLKPLHIKKLATYVHRTSARSTLLVFLLSILSVCSSALGRSVVSLKSPMAFLLGSLWWPSWRLELPGLHRSVLTVSSSLWV